MSKVGTASGQADGHTRATGWLTLLIRRFGNWLFQAEDERARQHGWQITARRGGLARTYWDPRFDRFRRCPECDGTGTCPGGQSCGPCAGMGRITLTEWSLTDRGRDK
jgi:hypothetical protein